MEFYFITSHCSPVTTAVTRTSADYTVIETEITIVSIAAYGLHSTASAVPQTIKPSHHQRKVGILIHFHVKAIYLNHLDFSHQKMHFLRCSRGLLSP